MSEEDDKEVVDDTGDEGGEQGGEQNFDYESAAKEMGWNPEYDGPGKRTAKEFYERGMEIQPILQKNYENIRKDNQHLKSKLDEQSKAFKKSIDVLNKHLKSQYEDKMEKIRADKAQAVADADEKRFSELEKAEEKLRQSEPKEEKVEVPDVMQDPAVQEWVSRNPWVNTDQQLAAYAQSYSQFVMNTNPGLSNAQLLEEVEKGVKEKFPEKFENTRRNNNSVQSPKAPPAKKKDKGWSDLPAEAKQAYKEINDYPGVEMSKEKYAKEYFAMEDE